MFENFDLTKRQTTLDIIRTGAFDHMYTPQERAWLEQKMIQCIELEKIGGKPELEVVRQEWQIVREFISRKNRESPD